MFSQHFNIPKQHYRVEKYPEFADLQSYLAQAGKIKGVKHCFYWSDSNRKCQYTLSIHIKAEGGDKVEPEYWMHESSDTGPRMLWFYRTDDIGVIFSQIMQSVGAPDPTRGEKEKPEVGSLTDRFSQSAQAQQRYVTPGSSLAGPKDQSAPRQPAAVVLSGNLETMPISTVLERAAKEVATGRLLIESPEMGAAQVHFVHGHPVHASSPSQVGLEALLELFVWQRGRLTFTQGTKADTTSIQQTADQILYQGAQLLENIGFLQDFGIDEHSVLRRVPLSLSEQEFEKRVLEGPPLGLELQKRFFQSLDGSRELKTLASLLALSSSQWIGITANLLRLGLILTPDGRNVQFAREQELEHQRISSSFSASAGPGPQGGFGKTGETQPVNPVQRQVQAISGGWQAQPAPSGGNAQESKAGWHSQETTGSGAWNPQTISGGWNPQGTSGSFTSQSPATNTNSQAASSNWNPQATSGGFNAGNFSSKIPMPPSSAFGGGPPKTDASEPPSPAVEAFITTSFTIQDLDTVHVGVQTSEVPFNKTAPKAVLSSLNNKETGILSFEAFQFFLDREFARAFRYSTNFSLVVFCMKLRSSGRPTMMASKIVSLTCNAIDTIKHDVDIFGHFGEKSYGLILPNTNSSQAATLVDKITTNLVKVAPDLSNCRPAFYIGIASVPTDAKDVEELVSAAQKAMMEAVKRNVTRLLYCDL